MAIMLLSCCGFPCSVCLHSYSEPNVFKFTLPLQWLWFERDFILFASWPLETADLSCPTQSSRGHCCWDCHQSPAASRKMPVFYAAPVAHSVDMAALVDSTQHGRQHHSPRIYKHKESYFTYYTQLQQLAGSFSIYNRPHVCALLVCQLYETKKV